MSGKHPIVMEWLNGDNDAGGTIAKLEGALVSAERERDEAVEMLRELHFNFSVCPICDAGQDTGSLHITHKPDCRLDKLLRSK